MCPWNSNRKSTGPAWELNPGSSDRQFQSGAHVSQSPEPPRQVMSTVEATNLLKYPE